MAFGTHFARAQTHRLHRLQLHFGERIVGRCGLGAVGTPPPIVVSTSMRSAGETLGSFMCPSRLSETTKPAEGRNPNHHHASGVPANLEG